MEKEIPKDIKGDNHWYWRGFAFALNLLEQMYGKNNYQHEHNIVDCVRAKANRLDKNKIRPSLASPKQDEQEAAKYMADSIGDKEAAKVEMDTMQSAIDRASNIMDEKGKMIKSLSDSSVEKDSRIKELEDGLRLFLKVINRSDTALEYYGDAINNAEQLLNPK